MKDHQQLDFFTIGEAFNKRENEELEKKPPKETIKYLIDISKIESPSGKVRFQIVVNDAICIREVFKGEFGINKVRSRFTSMMKEYKKRCSVAEVIKVTNKELLDGY